MNNLKQLRKDIEAKWKTLNRAGMQIPMARTQLVSALETVERGGTTYLSSQLIFAKLLGITIPQLRKRYCINTPKRVR